MFGKDAECSSVEATSLLFSAGAEPRRPGLRPAELHSASM